MLSLLLSNVVITTLMFFNLVSATFPDTPFTTSGRDILSASGEKVLYAGVNWPGSIDTMLPEGLQYRSIANIVSAIKSLGMNVVRLTYAIEMIDDYYDNSPSQTLQATLTNALGSSDGASVLKQILSNNPQFNASTTRLEVFDAVAEECANQEIWVHLNNQISKAGWCCSQTYGNAWFGDTYFNVANWQRGLGFMADRAKSWTAFASMDLRNELRQATGSSSHAQPYDWPTWLSNMIPAADAIYGNNNLPLIFFSGLEYDTDDTFIINGTEIDGAQFSPTCYDFQKKIVFEIHNYDLSATACSDISSGLTWGAYGAMDLSHESIPNKAPVVLTEFGYPQTSGNDQGVYAQCIKSTLTSLPGGPGGWMQWVIAGSYYISNGVLGALDMDGLFNDDWSAWRDETIISEYEEPFVKATVGRQLLA